ncbi:MAG: phosphatidylglycerophosphatase A family protein [Desulfovibrionaceae bacterium]
MKSIALTVVSLIGVGYVPLASGTIASFITLPFIMYILSTWDTLTLLYTTVTLFFIGVLFSHFATRNEEDHDPSTIVIDEAMGQCLTFVLVAPYLQEVINLWIYFWGFVFFRIFDVIKVQPARWIDSSVNNAWGVMLDDAIAGIYAALALYAVHKYFFVF